MSSELRPPLPPINTSFSSLSFFLSLLSFPLQLSRLWYKTQRDISSKPRAPTVPQMGGSFPCGLLAFLPL